MSSGSNWFWRHYLSVNADDGLRVHVRHGNWGLIVNADYWCGELQLRLGRLGVHIAIASCDGTFQWQRSRSMYWSGVRLYVGRGSRMRLVDAWERRVPVADMWPHLGYTGLMGGA